ncbi:hypothetical protein JK628_13175 [Shewanella sp. KX20019]|uniref:hypothetical protein n=1 Tax=Shewanella sp. KX20019 TaxID=2803864 RepID=UPI001926DD41|nr:hypothetical protein [Shewanella sp. KX20019]QQX78533.1 hypothetical protein JK628_13175 [Shewanella sp. KX20019]
MQHDLPIEPMMNIKQLRSELKAWGRYWARQEQGQGYASRSACDRLGEPIRQTCSGGNSDHMPPDYITELDSHIGRLSPNCKRAIRAHYVCKGQWKLMGFDSQKSYIYWLRRAELEL